MVSVGFSMARWGEGGGGGGNEGGSLMTALVWHSEEREGKQLAAVLGRAIIGGLVSADYQTFRWVWSEASCLWAKESPSLTLSQADTEGRASPRSPGWLRRCLHNSHQLKPLQTAEWPLTTSQAGLLRSDFKLQPESHLFLKHWMKIADTAPPSKKKRTLHKWPISWAYREWIQAKSVCMWKKRWIENPIKKKKKLHQR